MQAEVADLFIEASRVGKQLFVETHSEHLVLRLQRRIAEGEISCVDIGIFSFGKDEKGTHVKKVEFDETGSVKEKEPFPGFFEVGLAEAIKRAEALALNKD